jgi:hypothetical protein
MYLQNQVGHVQESSLFLGLLETEGEGKTVLRKGGSCLLLHTVQHPSRLESATKAG